MQSTTKAERRDNVWWAAPVVIALLAGSIAFLVRTDTGESAAWYVYIASYAAMMPVVLRAVIRGLGKQLVRIPGLLIALVIMGVYLFVFHRDASPLGS